MLFLILVMNACASRQLYTSDDIGTFAGKRAGRLISYESLCDYLEGVPYDTLKRGDHIIFKILPVDGIAGLDACWEILDYNIVRRTIESSTTVCQ